MKMKQLNCVLKFGGEKEIVLQSVCKIREGSMIFLKLQNEQRLLQIHSCRHDFYEFLFSITVIFHIIIRIVEFTVFITVIIWSDIGMTYKPGLNWLNAAPCNQPEIIPFELLLLVPENL